MRASADLGSDRWATRLAVACCAPICLAYGLAGLIYGHLAMLTPAGFIDMPGACAWLTSLGAFALAAGAAHGLAFTAAQPHTLHAGTRLTTHTVRGAPAQPARQVQVATTSPTPARPALLLPDGFLGLCLLVAAIACASALAGRALQSIGLDVFQRPAIALAPRAEWPLWPLPWIWRALIPLARNDLVLALLGLGVLLLLLCGLLERRRVRGAWALAGVVLPMLFAAAQFGSAAYDYAMARGLADAQDAQVIAAFAQAPGRHNMYTFISLWNAIGCLTVVPLLGWVFGRRLRIGDSA